MNGLYNVILHAPSVHTGGGFVLLRALTETWPRDLHMIAWLDVRARGRLVLPENAEINWVYPSATSRLKAEIHLSSNVQADDVIVCFHGLPPLFSCNAKVVVFLQNRLYFSPKLSSGYRLKTRIRLTFERLVSRVFRYRVSEYIVQTPSMRRDVLQWYEVRNLRHPAVRVLPFVETLYAQNRSKGGAYAWDFVYVADGEAHKNHPTLLKAWQLLAKDGLYPSLALTLSSRDTSLRAELQALIDKGEVRIKDLGQLPHIDVLSLYSDSRAMIFPSMTESFGLPLIEAAQAGLPILASELDYVRDVCVPVQTFDPASPVSIARAVKRFLGVPEPRLELRSPQDFLRELMGVSAE
jgi:glycosyltransferase involved in cell wall biosynthesis